jgi:hypothetical protein
MCYPRGRVIAAVPAALGEEAWLCLRWSMCRGGRRKVRHGYPAPVYRPGWGGIRGWASFAGWRHGPVKLCDRAANLIVR